MANAPDVYEMLQSEQQNRDVEWEWDFLRALSTARFRILNEEPVVGPDGWPYLLVAVDPEGSESPGALLSWLSERGIGLVLNAQKETPDYVLTYGMIWNFRERGEFLSGREVKVSSKLEYTGGEIIHSGSPSTAYLPEYTRTVLREFFKQNGTPQMKVLVLNEPHEKRDQYSLCFSLEALGEPQAGEHKGILEALSWFLPAHYALALMSEKNLPQFHEL